MTKQDELESLAQTLETSGGYRVLRKLPAVERYCADDSKPKKQGIFLDLETTDLSPERGAIIELAMLPFQFTADGTIYAVGKCLCEFEDPGVPIPELVSKLTGIGDADVRGKKISDESVAKLLQDSAVVIAHNAAFDRPFFEKRFAFDAKTAWACSQSQIPWGSQGIRGRSLEFLGYRYGFFFDGHRAEFDCRAGVHLLSQKLPLSGESVLKSLLDAARRKSYRLWAKGSAIEKKDLLKERGYKWRPDSPHRAWCIEVGEEELQSERQFLFSEIYGRDVELPIDSIDCFSRFSGRG